ncbi:toxin-antitoxin system YwqK family antitoxin [Flavobacterium tibetense]|jgi:antitoxin component YwqK of YwqJK toxin-antitoxin module|uniref:hypothetical protein n=1 Tax=Flavobacterium tibetense TaxID=2233533 RepID=UPI001057F4F4|nr:hypothetical protein [Flavobacterium tibetense]
MKKIITICVLLFAIYSCKEDVQFDLKKQNQMVELSDKIFAIKKIDSKKVLKLIEKNSTEIFEDTAKTDFNPKPLIYSNLAGKTFFKVYERPKGTVYAISFYKNNTEINTAEYFDNGQVQCLFKIDKKGIKNGKYNCFHRNGKIRKSGEYLNNKNIGIEIGYDSIGNKSHEFDYSTFKYIK